MGVTSAVHWWEESQMRVLAISSLVIQFLLLIFTRLRRLAIPGWIRFFMWLAYLGGDAIAIYALATLFNRHKVEDRGGKNTLELVWAPILLLHLGGHDGMTAYNIEDNELWSRHLLTAVSQVTVAIYVFSKSWPRGGDKRLLQAAIVLFVPGVLKCFTKPWALNRASIKSLVISPSTQSTTKKTNEDMEILDEYVQQRAKAGVQEQKYEGKQNKGEMDTFEWYVKGAMAFVREQKDEGNALQVHPRAPVEGSDHLPLPSQQGDDTSSSQDHQHFKRRRWSNLKMILYGETHKQFVDLSSPYPLRLSLFRCFWTISEEGVDKAYGSVRRGLARAFILLYTKLKTTTIIPFTWIVHEPTELDLLSALVVYSRFYLPWAAVGLFHYRHGEDYSGIDVKITYALICCTSVVELYSMFFLVNYIEKEDDWPEVVAQYNLMEYFVRNKNHSNMMWIASMPWCKDFVDQHWCMKSCSSSSDIAGLVLEYLKAGWKEEIHDSVSYRKFNDNRGQCALKYEDKLGWSIKGPFDKSVLLWHIATDFCFFWRTPPHNDKKAVQCRQISNYMMYLLFVNPEMLLPGTRRNLFTTAYDELKRIVGDENLNPQSCCCCCQQVVEKGLMETLISTMKCRSSQENSNMGSEEKFIDEAWDLAQRLQNMGDDKMWKVIQGVWLEMLCFSASRCRGYLHAKALGSGGEFLSHVWLLMFYMGMETLTERLQREELPSQEANSNATPTPQASDVGNPATSSTSGIRSRGASSPSHVHTASSPSRSGFHIVDMD